MYTNHRVKKRDFVKLVNYHRHHRNLKPIRSSTTVYNRSRPCNKRSNQAKLHLGLGLFCAKKPPKTEKNENELTHHQRAHKRNIINFLCDAEREEEAQYVMEISMDDKAYLCPGTSTGMSGARSLKIYQPSNDEEARKLVAKKASKKEKVVAISHHIAFQELQRSLAVKSNAARVMSDVQSESEDDEEEDVIIDIAGKEDSSNTFSEGEVIQDETPDISKNEEFEEDLSHLFCVTRSGRLTQTWACSRYRCKFS